MKIHVTSIRFKLLTIHPSSGVTFKSISFNNDAIFVRRRRRRRWAPLTIEDPEVLRRESDGVSRLNDAMFHDELVTSTTLRL